MPRGVPNESFESRFWKRVEKSDDCWIWTGARNEKGYGNVWPSRKAHRVSWEMRYGEIPDGLFVLHECDNPPCVCPDHLFLGTNRDNIIDAIRKGRLDLSKLHAAAHHIKNRRRGKQNHNHGSTHLRGVGNPSSKLTEELVKELRSLEGTMSQRLLAERFCIGETQVSRILRRVLWRHIP